MFGVIVAIGITNGLLVLVIIELVEIRDELKKANKHTEEEANE